VRSVLEYIYKYLKLEIRGRNWFSVIISYLCCYVCLLFYGFDVVLAERSLFSTYKKCKANCEVLHTPNKIFWIVKFPFLWTHNCVCEKLILLYQLWEILVYISYNFLSEFARLTRLYVIVKSALFVLVVHCHSDATYQMWSFVVSEIFKLVSSLLLLQKYIHYDLVFFCTWLVAIVITLISLWEGVLIRVCIYIYIYIYIYTHTHTYLFICLFLLVRVDLFVIQKFHCQNISDFWMDGLSLVISEL
jgi:hypothetical protein